MSAEARRELLRAEQALPEHTRHFDPPPAAEDVFPALRRHMKRLRELREKQAAYEADARRLADERFAVEAADREQLGFALAAGNPPPDPQLPAHDELIERANRAARALDGPLNAETRALTATIGRRREIWLAKIAGRTNRAATHYGEAVAALAAARESLVTDLNLGAWLDAYPAQPRPLDVDTIPAHPLLGTPGQFSQLLADLERDVANLPTRSPITISFDPFSRYQRFVRRRPPSYWAALDRIEELER